MIVTTAQLFKHAYGKYAVGAYNVLGWQYDTVPSGEFVQRTIAQPGRTFLASLGVTF